MVPQVFHWADLASIFALVGLEILLSADNALVLAVIAKSLPTDQRSKALTYGVVGAFIMRFIGLIGAMLIMKLWWLQAIGALYLIFLGCKNLIPKKGDKKVPEPSGFWQTVLVIEMIDFVFAIDSILAGVAFVGGDQSKLWVVWLGGIIGIVALRFVAGFFIGLLEKYEKLETLAYVIVAWVGIKLATLAGHSAHVQKAWSFAIEEMSKPMFFGGLFLICAIGVPLVVRASKLEADHEQAIDEA